MAALPAYELQASSSRIREGGPVMLEDTASNGQPLTRVLTIPGPVIYYRFNLLFRYLSLSEAEALEQFFLDNVANQIEWTWKDGKSYTGVFGQEGVTVDKQVNRGSLYEAVVVLRGAAQ